MTNRPFTAVALAVFWPVLALVALALAAAPSTRPAAAIAVTPATSPATTPSTAPAADRLVYFRADGGFVELTPADAGYAPVNQDVTGATLQRGPDRAGAWVVARVVPAAPTDGVVVPSGGDVTAALAAATSGRKVYLVRGGEYGPIGNATIRPHNVTLTAWGDPNKPAPRVKSSGGRSGLYLWAVDGFTVDGLVFEGDGTGTEAGAGIDLWGVRQFTARYVEVTRHRGGATVNPAKGRRPDQVTFERCWIHDNSPQRDGRHGQGLYAAETDRLTLTACTFERNGWSATYAGSSFNHGVYVQALCGPPTITGCTFKANSSHGLQARSGGTVVECEFVDNPIHLSWALVNGDGPIHPGGCTGIVNRNRFSGTRPVAGAPRGWALEIGDNVVDLTVTGNLFDFGADAFAFGRGAAAAAIKLDVGKPSAGNPDTSVPVGVRQLTIADNLVSWPSADPKTGLPIGALWIHPAIVARQQLRDGRTRIVAQTVWPPAR